LAPLPELVALDRHQADFSRQQQLADSINALNPDVIVNAGAYTAVDRAEAERDLATTIDATAVAALAHAARGARARLVHYSTDYVFDGTQTTPYVETDPPAPLNVYGQSKLDG